jgi:hypothetical protein
MGGPSLQQRLYAAQDWCEWLRSEAAAVRAEAPTPERAALALELARLLEQVEPDRNRAVEMYLVAWKGARDPAPLVRARALCLELGDLDSVAKIARLECQHREDPALLFEEGIALLDADAADDAIRPLTLAAKARPDDPAVVAALRAARNEWPNPRAELERLVGEAKRHGPSAAGAAAYLQAARILRLLRGDPVTHAQLLEAAFTAWPADDRAYALLERYLVAQRDGDRLLALYRRRVATSPTLEARYEDLRRAGVGLVLRGGQPGLGLRLLDRALREIYSGETDEIPGQIACLELLRRHAEASRSLPRFLQLVADALARPQGELDGTWLSAQGLQIAWRELGDLAAGRAYAGRLARHAANHPTLRAYLDGGGLTDLGVAADDDEPVYLDAGGWGTAPDTGGPIGLAAATGSGPTAAAAAPPTTFGDATADEPLELLPEEPAAPSAPPPDVAPPELELAAVAPPEVALGAPAAPLDDEVLPATMPPRAPRTLGRVALVARPAHLVRPGTAPPVRPIAAGSLIPRGALAALERASRERVVVPSPPPPPATARPRAPRTLLPIDLTMNPRDGQAFEPLEAVTRDFSGSGLFVVTEVELPLDAPIRLALRLPRGGLDVAIFETDATIVRREAGRGFGVSFVDPPAALVAAIGELVTEEEG